MFGRRYNKTIALITLLLTVIIAGCGRVEVAEPEPENTLPEATVDVFGDEKEVEESEEPPLLVEDPNKPQPSLPNYTRSDIEELFESADEIKIPEGVYFHPWVMNDQNVLFGTVLDNGGDKLNSKIKTVALYDLNTEEFRIVYRSENEDETQMGIIGVCDEYLVFTELYTFGVGTTDTFLYDIKDGKTTKINSEENVPLIAKPHCAFGENGLLLCNWEASDGIIRAYYYDYETLTKQYVDEKVVVAGWHEGVFYGNLFPTNTFSSEEDQWIWMYDEASGEISTAKLEGIKWTVQEIGASDEIIVISEDEYAERCALYFYNPESRSVELILESPHIALMEKYNEWLCWMGGRVNSKIAHNVLNSETEEYYYTDASLYLSRSGLARGKKLTDTDNNILNSEEYVIQLIRFDD